MRPIGRTVYLMPPYILDDDEIDGLARQARVAMFDAVMPLAGAAMKRCSNEL